MSLDMDTAHLIALVTFSMVGLLLGRAFYRRLEKHHPREWRELGSPTLFWNQSPKNQVTVSRFLWSSGYRELNDPALNRLVLLLKLLGFAILGLLIFDVLRVFA